MGGVQRLKTGWAEQKRLSPSLKKPLKPKFFTRIFLLPTIIFNVAQQPLALGHAPAQPYTPATTAATVDGAVGAHVTK